MLKVSAYLLLPFLLFYAAHAQTTNGSITGRVTDPSKATVAEAKVVAFNLGTNFRYESTTNAAGEYTLTNLPPGTYRIEVEKPAFKKLIQPGVALHVQDTLEINFDESRFRNRRHHGGRRASRGNGVRRRQHRGAPDLRREHSAQRSQLPDSHLAHAWHGGDGDSFRRPGPVQRHNLAAATPIPLRSTPTASV
jgi:Carboxypeptidase regulatory-like domain